jgi:hypothetical protein
MIFFLRPISLMVQTLCHLSQSSGLFSSRGLEKNVVLGGSTFEYIHWYGSRSAMKSEARLGDEFQWLCFFSAVRYECQH